jgi:hypothetical protein
MNDSPPRRTRNTGRTKRPAPRSVLDLRRRKSRGNVAAHADLAPILEIHDYSVVRVSLEWLAREAELAQYELAAPTAPSAS